MYVVWVNIVKGDCDDEVIVEDIETKNREEL